MKTIQHRDLIDKLRAEADSLKECFTKFSFQAIAFSALVFGLLGKKETPDYAIIVASAFVVTMLLAVARIGIYKYGNANLVIGYELHLERTQNLSDTEDGWKSYMRDVGWEEARRAWRIVQPTVFRHLYYTNFLIPCVLRRPFLRRNPEDKWFEPSSLVESAGVGASYHPSGYLRLMLFMLHFLALLATLPVWVAGMRLFLKYSFPAAVDLSLAAGLCLFVCFRMIRDFPRLRLLENGLLSIHSCAVMWQAAVLAHYRALEAIRMEVNRGFDQYTKNLAIQASKLRAAIFEIDEWLGY